MNKISFWILLGVLQYVTSCGPARLEQKKKHFLHKGNLSFKEKMYQDAIRYYKEALQIDSSFAQAYNNLGVVYYRTGKFDLAVEAYDKCLHSQEDFTDAYFNRSNAYYELGEYQLSLNDLNHISKTDNREGLLFAKGLSFFALKQYDSARYAFANVLEKDTSNVEAYINLANTNFYLHDMEQAEILTRKALAMDGRLAEAFNLLGMISAQRLEYQNALEYYQQGLSIESNNAFILNNRGYLYIQLGELQLALKDINESIVINPENTWAYLYKGIYYFAMQDMENAERLLSQSISMEPTIGLSYLYLGKIYKESGNLPQACELFQKASDLGELAAKEEKSKFCD